jgi:UDP-N-acetyl-2-amino-2-deoxyglucuronate dehydrogenase
MTLKLAFIGTGGIASAHLRGVAEVNQQGGAGAERLYELVALADPRAEAREALAAEAETTLGQRPSVYGDYREMLEREALDVAALQVPHNLHWQIARDCLDAGLHLQVQKPIALTIAEGRRIIEYAQEKGRAMVVSEPAVLGRKTRAILGALQDESLVGTPTMLLDYAVTILYGGFFAGTPWRHLKGMAGAGWFVDHGVHRAHWFLEALGPVAEAYALAKTFEPVRRDERHGTFTVDTEDGAMATLRFEAGALGHWLVASAGHGARFGAVRVYGTQGVVSLDSGTVQQDRGEVQQLEAMIQPLLDERIPADPMAHSFAELHALISAGSAPISSGEQALEALAVVYACLEAATTGRATMVADVLSGAAHGYEDTIEAARALVAEAEPGRVS